MHHIFVCIAGACLTELRPVRASRKKVTLTFRNNNTVSGAFNSRLFGGTVNIDLASPDFFDVLSFTTGKTTPTVSLTLSEGSNAGSTLQVQLGYDAAVGQMFRIVDVAGSNLISGKFSNGDTVSAVRSGTTYNFNILYNSSLAGGSDNDVVLQVVSVVPEPATIVLAGLGVGMAGLMARNRRRAA